MILQAALTADGLGWILCCLQIFCANLFISFFKIFYCIKARGSSQHPPLKDPLSLLNKIQLSSDPEPPLMSVKSPRARLSKSVSESASRGLSGRPSCHVQPGEGGVETPPVFTVHIPPAGVLLSELM